MVCFRWRHPQLFLLDCAVKQSCLCLADHTCLWTLPFAVTPVLRSCVFSFQGMDLTTDKLRSMVRKWQTLIECHVDVKTTDNYVLRIFAISFTKRRQNQIRKTSYAQSSQIRQV